MAKPQFIYFDMGNVILLFDHQLACDQIGQVAGISGAQVREIVFESELQNQYETGQITSREFYDSFCEMTNTAADYDQLLVAASDIFSLNTPVIPLLAALRDAGIAIGIFVEYVRRSLAIRSPTILDSRPVLCSVSFEFRAQEYETGRCHLSLGSRTRRRSYRRHFLYGRPGRQHPSRSASGNGCRAIHDGERIGDNTLANSACVSISKAQVS